MWNFNIKFLFAVLLLANIAVGVILFVLPDCYFVSDSDAKVACQAIKSNDITGCTTISDPLKRSLCFSTVKNSGK